MPKAQCNLWIDHNIVCHYKKLGCLNCPEHAKKYPNSKRGG